MNGVTPDQLMTTAYVLLAVFAAIVTVDKVIDIFKKWRSPTIDTAKKLATYKQRLDDHEKGDQGLAGKSAGSLHRYPRLAGSRIAQRQFGTDAGGEGQHHALFIRKNSKIKARAPVLLRRVRERRATVPYRKEREHED